MELEKLTEEIKGLIRSQMEPSVEFAPCKVSIWIKPIRHKELDGSRIEETAGPVQKVLHDAQSHDHLVHLVAENALIAVYGAEAPLAQRLPNLIVKLFDRKAYIRMPDGPALDEADQLFLKVTVYRHEPGLWERLFGKRQ